MHKLTFFPLGNADCCFIELENKKKILFDYADTRNPDDDDDPRCDLPALLREELEDAGRNYVDVLALTHLDEDHYKGATDFFWLDHAEKYQGDDRIKINTLWVPAAAITETELDKEEARVLQKEARHRFKEGRGIRVFSRPDRLRDWCESNDIDFEERRRLITDAGQVAPGFSLDHDGVEFFVHSPFAKRLNETEVEDRNDDAIVVQATFEVSGVQTRVLLLADVTHEILADIVEVTRDKKGRPERLAWEVAKLAHHCSYLSLGPDKGRDKTTPVDNVNWLWADRGQNRGIIVSSSKPIPKRGSKEDTDTDPPHRQAANYYKGVVSDLDGEFIVTMEQPPAGAPRPVVIEIDAFKARPKKIAVTGPAVITTTRTPRAGSR